MRRAVWLIIIALLMSLLSVSYITNATDGISVTVDAKKVDFPDAKPFIDENGRTLIPVRFVTEALGAKVEWKPEDQEVYITKDAVKISLRINDRDIVVNNEIKTMDTKALIKEDRTFVPIRYVAEELGAKVGWNDSKKTVIITTDNDKSYVHNPDIPEGILESWVGDYTFSEFAPPDQNRYYSISIFEENEEGFANISIDGFQTMTRIQAKVEGDENFIKFIFNSYLPDNNFELYKTGDVLLSFKKDNSFVYTYWDKIDPMLESNKELDIECFKKILDEDENGYLVGIWHASPSIGAGFNNIFFFHKDKRFEFYYSQYDEEKRTLNMSGQWNISNDKLILSISQKTVIEGGELVEASPSASSKYQIINGTIKKVDIAPAQIVEYTIKFSEEAEDSPYEIKLLLNGEEYCLISEDAEDEHFKDQL